MTNKTKGFIYGAIAAASYGMNPLFALPLYAAGMSVDTVLFYRYFFATIVLGILMKMQHQSFALHKADVLPLVIMGLLFSFSSLLLFMSYNYMDAGIASTILFVYPVMVAVIIRDILQRKDFRNYRFFHPAGTFWYRLALSGRRKQTAVDFGNYLCSAVLTLLCYIYSRCEPFDAEKPADHQAHILRNYVRTIGLYRPFKFLHGTANNTVSLALGRRADTGHSANCRISDLYRTRHPLYRLYSNSHTGCSGTCDSSIFRCSPVSRKTDSPVNGRYFNDYHRCYLNYHR